MNPIFWNTDQNNDQCNNQSVVWDALAAEHEIALLHADVCIASPESYSLAEKREITEQIDAAGEAIEKAIREDFQSWKPEAQAAMLDLLQKADPDHFDYWTGLLIGEMPDAPIELAERLA